MKRYEIFCRKLVLERHYTASAFITSNRTDGPDGISSTPSEELSVKNFTHALTAHAGGFVS
ncbi:MAG: PaeR7I family type II restriction endonuclease [Desulfotignum sp.]